MKRYIAFIGLLSWASLLPAADPQYSLLQAADTQYYLITNGTSETLKLLDKQGKVVETVQKNTSSSPDQEQHAREA